MANTSVNGYLGLGTKTPRSQFHIQGPTLGSLGTGWRPWMRTGTYASENSNAMYTGMYFTNLTTEPDAVVNWSDNFGGASNRLRINFTENNGGITPFPTDNIADMDKEMASFWPSRNVGVGDFINFTTGPKRHLHMHNAFGTSDYMEFTNTTTIGANNPPVASGFHIGMNNTLSQLIQYENDHVITYTNVAGAIFGERMRVTHIGAPGVLNPGLLPNNQTKIGISLDPVNPVTRPLSLLHLGFNTAGVADGWRPWMANGMFVSQESDNVFIGLKQETYGIPLGNRYDAVINWGDDMNGLPPIIGLGPDNLRFIFTSYAASGDSAAGPNGLEVGRFSPGCQNCPINKPSFGVGNFAPSNGTYGPGGADYVDATLDVDGDANIRTVTQNDGLTQVLVRNPLDHGRLHWRDASTLGGPGGTIIAQNGLTQAPVGTIELGGTLLHPTTIEMANFDFNYQNTAIDRWHIAPGGQLFSNITGTGANWGYRMDITNHEQGIKLALNSSTGTTQGLSLEVNGAGFVDGSYTTAQGSARVNGHRILLTGTGTDKRGIDAYVQGATDGYGIVGVVLNATNAYGGYFYADNNAGTTNNMYGVYSRVAANQGANNQYGVYSQAPISPTSWAGYFEGNLNVNGQYYLGGAVFTSDPIFKTDVDTISNASQIISQLTPRTFFFDTTNVYGMNFSNQRQYGFLTTEIQPVLPELVSGAHKPAVLDTLGNVVNPAVDYDVLNYNAMIALLTKGMQEQQTIIQNLTNQVNDLTAAVNNCCSQGNSLQSPNNNGNNTNGGNYNIVHSTDVRLTDSYCVLSESSPNPFRENAVINYNLSDKIKTAQIVFFNALGQVIKTVDINDRGEGRLNVFAEDLRSGMYTYSLIVDGNVCETKKMIKE